MKKVNFIILLGLLVSAAGCAAEAGSVATSSDAAPLVADPAGRFAGTWTFDEASKVTVACPDAPAIVTSIARTTLELEVGADGTLHGVSSVGCHYAYDVDGSVATLVPGQECRVPDGQGGETVERLDHDVLTLVGGDEGGSLTLDSKGIIGPGGACALTVAGSLHR
jgi:hypothetical protein